MCGAKKLMHFRFTRAWPERMIGDTAYDSDPLDRQLWREHRIRMNRAQPPQPPESDPGPSRVAPLLSSLENRTPFRLAA